MIKEKRKEQKEKKITQIVLEYGRTILISIVIACIFTTILTINARNEMIKNLYVNVEERQKIDEMVAKQLVNQADLSENLATKKYSICMNVGHIYETAKDYKNAQIAYELAISKAKQGIYTPYAKLTTVLIAQEKFKEAEQVIKSVPDVKNKDLIKFKTRSYIEMGDKYYSIGKFLSAAKNYEKAKFYYDRFSKRDKKVVESIQERIVNSYIETAGIMVKNGYNSDAVRFLKKAEQYKPNDFHIKYKLAIIYADYDPVISVEYFEQLLSKMPQEIDYSTYNKALMKAATIEDLSGNPTQAKYYRYKIHSVDLFVNQKVVYRNDLEVFLDAFNIRKTLFKYHLKGKFRLKNVSSNDIMKMSADFVLKQGNTIKESYTVECANRKKPLLSNGSETDEIEVRFGKNILTKRELALYTIDIYVYKDPKYKTLLGSFSVPEKSFNHLKK